MDKQEIRKRVEKRIKERNEFIIHLAVYIMVMALLWVIYIFSSDLPATLMSGAELDFPWPIIPMMGWGIGIVAHGLTVFFNSPGRIAARERMIQREVERERERLEAAGYDVDKRKRDSLYRLSDDGELIEVTDEDPDDQRAKRKH